MGCALETFVCVRNLKSYNRNCAIGCLVFLDDKNKNPSLDDSSTSVP